MLNVPQEVTQFLVQHIVPNFSASQIYIYLVGSNGKRIPVDIDIMILGSLPDFLSIKSMINQKISLWEGPPLDLHFLPINEWKEKNFQTFNTYFHSILLREQGVQLFGSPLTINKPSDTERRIFHYKCYLQNLDLFSDINSSYKHLHLLPSYWCYGQIYKQNIDIILPAGKDGFYDHFMNLEVAVPGLKEYVSMLRWRRHLLRTKPAIFYCQTKEINHFNQVSRLNEANLSYIREYIARHTPDN